MTSTTFFFIFIPLLAIILLMINLIFAPHNPYLEKDSAFECGFHSFLAQNRTQFSISFFIFALLFLLFDLEILLVYPYTVSAYANGIYGLVVMVLFFLVITLGFAFELGKNALKLESRQTNSAISLKFHGFIHSYTNSGLDPDIIKIIVDLCNDPEALIDIVRALCKELCNNLPEFKISLHFQYEFSFSDNEPFDCKNIEKVKRPNYRVGKFDGILSTLPPIQDLKGCFEGYGKQDKLLPLIHRSIGTMVVPLAYSSIRVFMLHGNNDEPNIKDNNARPNIKDKKAKPNIKDKKAKPNIEDNNANPANITHNNANQYNVTPNNTNYMNPNVTLNNPNINQYYTNNPHTNAYVTDNNPNYTNQYVMPNNPHSTNAYVTPNNPHINQYYTNNPHTNAYVTDNNIVNMDPNITLNNPHINQYYTNNPHTNAYVTDNNIVNMNPNITLNNTNYTNQYVTDNNTNYTNQYVMPNNPHYTNPHVTDNNIVNTNQNFSNTDSSNALEYLNTNFYSEMTREAFFPPDYNANRNQNAQNNIALTNNDVMDNNASPWGVMANNTNPEGVTGNNANPEGVTGNNANPEGVTGNNANPEGVTGNNNINEITNNYLLSLREYELYLFRLRTEVRILTANHRDYLSVNSLPNDENPIAIPAHLMASNQISHDRVIELTNGLNVLYRRLNSLRVEAQNLNNFEDVFTRHLGRRLIYIPISHIQFWHAQLDTYMVINDNLRTIFQWKNDPLNQGLDQDPISIKGKGKKRHLEFELNIDSLLGPSNKKPKGL